MGGQVHFFAIGEDLIKILGDTTPKWDFSYIETYSNGDEDPPYYRSLTDINNLSTMTAGDTNLGKHFMIIDAGETPRTRTIELIRGGVRKSIDASSHPKSVHFVPGGHYLDEQYGIEAVILGRVDTVSEHEWSNRAYRFIYSRIRRIFEKISYVYVGPEAMKLFESGIRFTSSVRSPMEYDLRR